ncbi:type I restriction-modification system subunit M [Mycoplasma sp. CSL10166]|uniref:type I restriction-modification system subunit M n=1 Tax=Mycoplasma sp. CSL10166 TaxID=2813825 RepID=UPI00197B0DDD|nr:type I restriction-modification system subunit M [Mycoplasma sp. CSL10166]MBN4084391.1 type I restriction-modification system subunit M [Mycoplasma sp. CSL10166]
MKKRVNKKELSAKIWNSANKLRNNYNTEDYKYIILPLIFYKFLSQKIIDFVNENEGITFEQMNELDPEYLDPKTNKTPNNGFTKEIIENIEEVSISEMGYYIPFKYLFQTWIKFGNDKNSPFSFNIEVLRKAIVSFDDIVNKSNNQQFKELYKGLLRIILVTLDKSNIENDKKQTATMMQLMEIINEIPVDGQNYDVIGHIYEYLLGKFATGSGKNDGEFYTPHEVSVLMSEIIGNHIKNRDKITIYDPTSGTGSLLLNLGKEFERITNSKDKVTYYAQDKMDAAYVSTRMNLIMNGIQPSLIKVRRGDTLLEDWPFKKNNDPSIREPQKVDAVVSNPPYSQEWKPDDNTNTDPRFSSYGVAPKSKADFAFLLHSYYHLENDGIMAIVLPHGVLFRGGSEKEIRTKLAKEFAIDTIIGLPSNMFFNTGISTIIMILKKNNNSKGNIQFIDASKEYVKFDSQNKFNISHIKKIAHAANNKTEVDNFSRIVSYKEIEENDFNLNISRYIDNFEKPEEYDLYSIINGGISQEEINKFNEYWKVFPNLKDKLFVKSQKQENYYHFKDIDNISETIWNNQDITEYLNTYNFVLNKIDFFLRNHIKDISNLENFNSKSFEEEFNNFFFSDAIQIPLLEKYQFYQLLHNIIDLISNDIEKINSFEENIPNNFIKEYAEILNENELEQEATKNKKKTKEIKEWDIQLLDYKTIAKFYFSDQYEKIQKLQEELNSLKSKITELNNELKQDEDSDDKTDETITSTKDELKIVKNNEKNAKQELQTLKELSVKQTWEKLLSLSNDELIETLFFKWTNDSFIKIKNQSNEIIDEFISKLNILNSKYSETLEDINKSIIESQNELASLLKELSGSETDNIALSEFIKILEDK